MNKPRKFKLLKDVPNCLAGVIYRTGTILDYVSPGQHGPEEFRASQVVLLQPNNRGTLSISSTFVEEFIGRGK